MNTPGVASFVVTKPPPDLPENFSFYSFQIAGHHYSKQKEECFGVLLCEKTGNILKPLQKPPRGDSEINFYENVWNPILEDDSTSKDPDDLRIKTLRQLRRFIPRYYGVKQFTADGIVAKFLELENLTINHKKPCVIDIKIGARTWDPLATEEKINYEKSKYPFAENLGFRFLGTMVYKETTDSYVYQDKEWGKMLTENDILPALQSYFPHELRSCKVLTACILRKLHQILELFNVQRIFHFYSSSVLISYDGSDLLSKIDRILTGNNNNNVLQSQKCTILPKQLSNNKSVAVATATVAPKINTTTTHVTNDQDHLLLLQQQDEQQQKVLCEFDALNCISSSSCLASNNEEDVETFFRQFDTLFTIKMIDFTHVFEQGERDGELDENYLFGLKNLIKYFTRFLDSLV